MRTEEAAAFMATEKPGVCVVTSGPGAIPLLNELHDAKLDHAPVLAMTRGRSLGAGDRLPAGDACPARCTWPNCQPQAR
jgi:hypothetical protein